MSFLLSALGGLAKPLLSWGGGWLFNKVKPLLGRVTSWASNLFGGKKKGAAAARTAMDSLMHRGINATFDGVKKFAKSDWLKNKMPTLASGIQEAAKEYRGKMHRGYREAMGPMP